MDIKNKGEIIINNKFVLHKHFSEKEFRSSSVFETFIRQKSGSYTRYYSTENMIGEDRMIISLYFNPSEIIEIIIISLLPNNKETKWESWNLEGEMQTKHNNDEWLKKQIGDPPYEFEWGNIYSVFDSRSASSYIEIRYKY